MKGTSIAGVKHQSMGMPRPFSVAAAEKLQSGTKPSCLLSSSDERGSKSVLQHLHGVRLLMMLKGNSVEAPRSVSASAHLVHSTLPRGETSSSTTNLS